MLSISINKAHFPVTTLGYGKRIGIWTQGCSRGCAGCISRDTWAHDPGKMIPMETLLAWCKSVGGQNVDGITISGGEPFEQDEALEALLIALRQWTDTLSLPVDILCYSGMPYRVLQKSFSNVLSHLDVLIPEPFLERQPTAHLRGSSNQRIVLLSDLGRSRYGDMGKDCLQEKKFQIEVEPDGGIWFIGIPERGDMERMEAYCASRGMLLHGHSWRS